jgi:hypothetical protein
MTTFDELLAARAAHAADFATNVAKYQRDLDTAWIAAARAKWPKKRQTSIATIAQALKLLTLAESIAVRESLQVEGEAYYAGWVIERDRIDEALRQLAATEPLSALPERSWRVWKRISISAFYSQGFGAERYALASAEAEADVAKLYGIDVVVKPGDHEYLVEVFATERDIEILTRRPGPSMREQIRVINPYLPTGLEAKLGLDIFGNDLPGYAGER